MKPEEKSCESYTENRVLSVSNKKHGVIVIITAIILFAVALSSSNAVPVEKVILKGRVTDVKGKAVKGAEIFIYNTPDTRRPADFISVRTGIYGGFSITLTPGGYWAVARLRSGEKYGPLMIGDKHSGEPVKVEINSDEELEQDFTVYNIKEAARLVKKTREDYMKISGKTVDKKGAPAKNLYVFANRESVLNELPDYISPWTDEYGEYTLYLPAGKYFIGYSSEFPPGLQYRIYRELLIENDNDGFNIVIDPFKKSSK